MPVKKTSKIKTPEKKPKPKAEAKAKEEAKVVKKAVKKLPYLFATGRRKTSVARVRLYPKDNRSHIQINGKDYTAYFPYFEFQKMIEEPLKKSNLLGKYFISIKVAGGGQRGQAAAIRHGLARVLLKLDDSLRKTFKAAGLLTRDSRKKERKKPGLKRARRAPQWQKR